MKPRVTAVTYVVSCFPEGYEDADVWDLRVEYRGIGLWAVCHFHMCLDAEGKMEYEPSPSNRTDEYKDRFRFTFQEAVRIAKKYAPTIRVNSMTPAEALERFPHRVDY